MGPVFKCIIGDTFARLKLGDRFFYDLSNANSDTQWVTFEFGGLFLESDTVPW